MATREGSGQVSRSGSRRPSCESLEGRVLMSGSLPGVPDVEAQFLALKHHGEGVGWTLPEDQGAPDPSLRDHYQGIVRYPGKGTPVFYVSQLDNDDEDAAGATTGGYLQVIRMGSRGTDGERLRSNLQQVGEDTESTPPPLADTWARQFRFNGRSFSVDGQTLRPYKHPGGMAIANNILFMPMDQPDGPGVGGEGMIVLFDLGRNGQLRESPIPIQAISLDHGIDNLAVTRAADGKYLIYTNGAGGTQLKFYKTTSSNLRAENLGLELVQDFNPGSADDFEPNHATYPYDDDGYTWPTDKNAHQSATFIRQSTGGRPKASDPLYMIGMWHEGGPFGLPTVGEDFADLFKVTEKPSGGFKLERVHSLHEYLIYDGADRIGNFAGGNNAYVSPTGELILYSVQHDDADMADPDYVKFAEIRHRDVNRPGSPLRGPQADAGGQEPDEDAGDEVYAEGGRYNVNEGGSVTLGGSGVAATDRPWVELFDDDNGWKHKFENDGKEGDRSIVIDFDDRHLFELNEFDELDDFSDKTTSVRWRAPVGVDIVLYDDDDFGDPRVILKGTGQTETVLNFETQVVVPGKVERPGKFSGELVEFNGKTSSMQWLGEPPESTLTLAWDLDGDGRFGETGSAAANGDEVGANPTFSAAGIDGPTKVPVTLRVTDDLGRQSFDQAVVYVANVAPKLSNVAATAVNENGVTTLTGSITDPGAADTFTIFVNWGDPLSPDNVGQHIFPAGTTSFTLTHRYLDDNPTATPADTYTIGLTVADDDGAATGGSASVTVSNVAPSVTDLTGSAPAANPAGEGEAVNVIGGFTDLGTLDTHSAVIDWGDGTTTPAAVVAATGSFSGSHAYEDGGVYTVTVTVSDDDGGSASFTTTAYVAGVGINNGQLQIIAPSAGSHIQVKRKGSTLEIMTDFDDPKTQVFDLSAVQSIRIVTGSGDDHVIVHKDVPVPVTVEPSEGNDHVVGVPGFQPAAALLP